MGGTSGVRTTGGTSGVRTMGGTSSVHTTQVVEWSVLGVHTTGGGTYSHCCSYDSPVRLQTIRADPLHLGGTQDQVQHDLVKAYSKFVHVFCFWGGRDAPQSKNCHS